MIDFACKQFSLDEVLKCSLGLSKADFGVFKFLVENDDDVFTTEKISKKLGLNLSTVQRAVKKLFEKQLLKRYQVNLDNGGYVFQYQIKPKKEIREVVMGIVSSWSHTFESALNKW